MSLAEEDGAWGYVPGLMSGKMRAEERKWGRGRKREDERKVDIWFDVGGG